MSREPDNPAKPAERRTVHFGSRLVGTLEKNRLVNELFANVAGNYNLMNDLMSGGAHRLWKRRFIQEADIRSGHRILDLAAGTGDIALGILERYRHLDIGVTACDPCRNMIAGGIEASRKRLPAPALRWVAGQAEKLPFADDAFDLCTMAFGLRNVGDRAAALSEILRVLKPGGSLHIMEFSPDAYGFIKPLYDFYGDKVIPMLGAYIARDREAYRYLTDSIRSFPSADDLTCEMEAAGFTRVTGDRRWNGIIAVHRGRKG